MTIRVTLQVDGKCSRREYKTYSQAISGLRRWFSGNNGYALLYQSGHPPAFYGSKHDLPHQPQISKNPLYPTQQWCSLRIEVPVEYDGQCSFCGKKLETVHRTTD